MTEKYLPTGEEIERMREVQKKRPAPKRPGADTGPSAPVPEHDTNHEQSK